MGYNEWASGQMLLFQERPTLLDDTIRAVLLEIEEALEVQEGKRPLPQHIDQLLLAVPLFILKNRRYLFRPTGLISRIKEVLKVLEEDQENFELEPYLFIPLERMPLHFAMAVLSSDITEKRYCTRVINDALTHSKSYMRLYAMEIIWIFRKEIDVAKVIPFLLDHLAEMLGYIEHGAALVRELLGGDVQFFAAAALHEPDERWADQYKSRVDQLKKNDILMAYTANFLKKELGCLQAIFQVMGKGGIAPDV